MDDKKYTVGETTDDKDEKAFDNNDGKSIATENIENNVESIKRITEIYKKFLFQQQSQYTKVTRRVRRNCRQERKRQYQLIPHGKGDGGDDKR